MPAEGTLTMIEFLLSPFATGKYGGILISQYREAVSCKIDHTDNGDALIIASSGRTHKLVLAAARESEIKSA